MKDKPRKKTTMNEMVRGLPGAGETIITPHTDIITMSGETLVSSVRDDKRVKDIMEYNKSVEVIEKEYSDEELQLLTGQIIVRLFRKLPVKGNIFMGYHTGLIGSKQLKVEDIKDPWHFANIGVIVNYDKTYERRDPWLLNVGDIVQINRLDAVTVIEKQKEDKPYLRRQFKRYDETRNTKELGYVNLTSQDIICKLVKFNIDEYHEEFFK